MNKWNISFTFELYLNPFLIITVFYKTYGTLHSSVFVVVIVSYEN